MISFYHINQTNHAKITVLTFNLNLSGFQNLTGLGRARLIAPLHRNPLTQRVILNSILTVEDIGFQSKTSKQSFENQSSDTNFLFLCF
jgi:hypothetical protein